MNRRLTFLLRTLMDEGLPPFIRDNRYFMYPFFHVWFKGVQIRRIMEFKSYCYDLAPGELAELYRTIRSASRNRATDLTEASLRFIREALDPKGKTLLDVGCGNGYFLKEAKARGYDAVGCDVLNALEVGGIPYVRGDIGRLPFPDKSFDIVTCHHTIEHIPALDAALSELKRVARRQLIVTTPCQRRFYYTLDLHVNFFPHESLLTRVIGIPRHTCRKIQGDWVYVGDLVE